MKILVVEDEPLVRMLMVEALVDEGFEVIECATGEQALAECRRGVADVLFTDIRLPGEVTGWDIAEVCRDIHPQLPVIYATGYSHVSARPVPGSIWFQKPYRIEHVMAAIRALQARAA